MSMSINIPSTTTKKYYRSNDGRSMFRFAFVSEAGGQIAIYCLMRPPLHGRDESVTKTHLYSSGQVCFVSGQEPRSQSRAEALAKQWAEYYLEYRRTGVAQA